MNVLHIMLETAMVFANFKVSLKTKTFHVINYLFKNLTLGGEKQEARGEVPAYQHDQGTVTDDYMYTPHKK